jgi:hypothetical protein
MTLKIWSLLDFMKAFQLGELTDLVQTLQAYQTAYQSSHGAQFDPEKDLYTPAFNLKKTEELCKELGWSYAKEKLGHINVHNWVSRHTADWSSIAADFRNALDVIDSEAKRRKFVQIDEKFADYVNNDALFGSVVRKAFPSAIDDIKAAGNCITVEEGTAAVFHLMRAVEWGLRAFCAHLAIYRIRKSKRSGQKKYIPVAFAQWDKMLDDVHAAVDKKIDKLSPGRRKQEAQEFYYPLLRDIKGFKDAWRNHVMHTRASYSTKQADDICDHVKAFMSALATRISE